MRSQASGYPSPPSPQSRSIEYIGVAFVHKPGGPALPRSFSVAPATDGNEVKFSENGNFAGHSYRDSQETGSVYYEKK